MSLWFALLPFLLGPLLFQWGKTDKRLISLLDGFIYIAIPGLVLFLVLPELYEQIQFWSIVLCLFGILLPVWMERVHIVEGKFLHRSSLWLGIIGLGLHTLFEGASYSIAGEDLAVNLAIAFHRLPVGLLVWQLLIDNYNRKIAWGGIFMLMGLTFLGFSLSTPMLENMSSAWTAGFQAFVIGNIMHVVLHSHHDKKQSKEAGSKQTAGIGGLTAILLLALIVVLEMSEGLAAFTGAFFDLLVESAPALLIGYTLAGLLHVFMPSNVNRWFASGNSFTQASKGMAFGLPLPVCSCGVVPLYQTMVKSGVPPAAGLAFLIATPEIGLDAILLSIPLLGTEFTLLRIAAAAGTALLIGAVVGRFFRSRIEAQQATADDCCEDTNCQSKTQPEPATAADHHQHDHGHDHSHDHSSGSLRDRVVAGLRAGFGEILEHTAPWILVGLVVAAWFQVWLGPGFFTQTIGQWDVLVFALVGIPLYVCASGTTPLVAALLVQGVSPGAALALLLTGPATNVTTYGIIARLHGRRESILFGITMLFLSVAIGYLVNFYWPVAWVSPNVGSAHSHGMWQELLGYLWLSLVGLAILRQGPRDFWGALLPNRILGQTSGH